MPDHLFADPGLAALYDVLNPTEDRGDFALLHIAREAGHGGRLCGVDPAEGMLEQGGRVRTSNGSSAISGQVAGTASSS
ncbi:hypothetical protein [Streptomyces sp. NPDC020681]|uniref:hypothetical protein n=1 Tax=Streptomyces sp. NPDC020681 TaxID=3365083 RepID=UPI0037B1FEA6